jgi:predicted glycosyl hydrolase (DUF1957 family)
MLRSTPETARRRSSVPTRRAREAEPLLNQSADWFIRSADTIAEQYRAERAREALQRLVRLYETWDTVAPESDRAEQAARSQAELDELPRR